MRTYIVLLITALLSFAAPAWADTPVPSASVTIQVTPQDVASMKDKMTQLSQALGNPVPATSAAPAASAQPDHKTVGDVADKALSLFSGMLGQVSDVLKKVAPEVWRIMIRQQYAKAAFEILTPMLLLISTLIGWAFLKKHLQETNDDSSDMGTTKLVLRFAFLCAPLIWSIWLAISIADSAAYVINPEYYAVKDLLMLMTNPSGSATPQ